MKEIIAAHQGRIKAIIKKLTGSYNEDIEQEVYIKTWRNLDRYHEEGKFVQWISALAANVCRDYLKSSQHRAELRKAGDESILEKVAIGGKIEERFDARERQKIILKAVDTLPKKLRQVIILFEFEEMSYEEIAKKTGDPVGTIKSRLFNARKLLSEVLQPLKGE